MNTIYALVLCLPLIQQCHHVGLPYYASLAECLKQRSSFYPAGGVPDPRWRYECVAKDVPAWRIVR
jgi:hypothetical protein